MVIMFVSRTHQMEDVKTDCTVQFIIPCNMNICIFPHILINIFMRFQFLIKSRFNKSFNFFFDCCMKSISRTFSFCIHRNIFYDFYFFSFFYMDITKFHTLLTKSAYHSVSKNLFSICISFDTASTTYMQMIFSGCNFHITSICCQLFIRCHISMFYLKAWCIIKINDRTINNTFYFNNSTVVERCHIKPNSHPVYIISAHKPDSFNQSLSSF